MEYSTQKPQTTIDATETAPPDGLPLRADHLTAAGFTGPQSPDDPPIWTWRDDGLWVWADHVPVSEHARAPHWIAFFFEVAAGQDTSMRRRDVTTVGDLRAVFRVAGIEPPI